jgi:hypothetical protein
MRAGRSESAFDVVYPADDLARLGERQPLGVDRDLPAKLTRVAHPPTEVDDRSRGGDHGRRRARAAQLARIDQPAERSPVLRHRLLDQVSIDASHPRGRPALDGEPQLVTGLEIEGPRGGLSNEHSRAGDLMQNLHVLLGPRASDGLDLNLGTVARSRRERARPDGDCIRRAHSVRSLHGGRQGARLPRQELVSGDQFLDPLSLSIEEWIASEEVVLSHDEPGVGPGDAGELALERSGSRRRDEHRAHQRRERQDGRARRQSGSDKRPSEDEERGLPPQEPHPAGPPALALAHAATTSVVGTGFQTLPPKKFLKAVDDEMGGGA